MVVVNRKFHEKSLFYAYVWTACLSWLHYVNTRHSCAPTPIKFSTVRYTVEKIGRSLWTAGWCFTRVTHCTFSASPEGDVGLVVMIMNIRFIFTTPSNYQMIKLFVINHDLTKYLFTHTTFCIKNCSIDKRVVAYNKSLLLII